MQRLFARIDPALRHLPIAVRALVDALADKDEAFAVDQHEARTRAVRQRFGFDGHLGVLQTQFHRSDDALKITLRAGHCLAQIGKRVSNPLHFQKDNIATCFDQCFAVIAPGIADWIEAGGD